MKGESSNQDDDRGDYKTEILWKVIGSAALGFFGLLTTFIAAGVTALIAWMFFIDSGIAVLNNSVEETSKSVQQIDVKVDSLDRRLTRLEQESSDSNARSTTIWRTELPAIKSSIQENRNAIRDLQISINRGFDKNVGKD